MSRPAHAKMLSILADRVSGLVKDRFRLAEEVARQEAEAEATASMCIGKNVLYTHAWARICTQIHAHTRFFGDVGSSCFCLVW